ncbi:F-box/kelch-repeat protein [Morus notabilis]|uniref:F-box/kelch-repeat protein n=1 Tax=Morus notabilis TaxID=981085 RepID=W9SLP2_9ROSA|nr:F-box/kelch-repeat protein [Morus notabilis]
MSFQLWSRGVGVLVGSVEMVGWRWGWSVCVREGRVGVLECRSAFGEGRSVLGWKWSVGVRVGRSAFEKVGSEFWRVGRRSGWSVGVREDRSAFGEGRSALGWSVRTSGERERKGAVEMKKFCHNLSEEILEEIFLRLPPVSVKSCKCVCKSWYDMINNPLFIKKQFHVSIKNNRHSSHVTLCLIWFSRELSKKEVSTGLYRQRRGKQVLSLLTMHKDDSVGDHPPFVLEEINLPPVPKAEEKNFPEFLIATHCNGIICFYGHSFHHQNTVVLCNTGLGEFKLLHTPCLPRFFVAGAGFGYDPKADDYKFVKVFSSAGFDRRSRALVYTLGTNSWREIDLKGIYCWLNNSGFYCRGLYYWWNKGLLDSETMVLSFDMSEEKFHCIKLPPIAQRPNGKFMRLTMWNESSVAFFISTERSYHSTSFELWVMVHKFDGVEGSTYWNKHLTIGPLKNIHTALAFWKDDELLMETRECLIAFILGS